MAVSAARTVRRALCALAVLAGVTAVPAQAAQVPTAREYVTLSGTGTRSVLVRFDRRVDFLAGADYSGEFYRPHISVTGNGIVGYAIMPARNGAAGPTVIGGQFPAAEGKRPVIWPMSGSDGGFSYPPGVYRLALVGTGTGSVRFRLPGLRPGGVTLTPKQPVTARISRAAVAAPSPFYVQPDSHTATKPLYFFDYTWYRSPVAAATRSSNCFHRGTPPQASAPGCVGGEEVSVAMARLVTDFESYSIGTAGLEPGTWTIASEVDAAGLIDEAGTVFVWLER